MRNWQCAASYSFPEDISGSDAEMWSQCCECLEKLGLTAEEANAAVKRGFGWGSQAYWRQERVKSSPSVDMIESALVHLEAIGMDKDADKAEVVKKFPEVLCIDQDLMDTNIAKLEKSFFLKGKGLVMSLKRKPKVLGATVDCQGDCAGECTRCFAQF